MTLSSPVCVDKMMRLLISIFILLHMVLCADVYSEFLVSNQVGTRSSILRDNHPNGIHLSVQSTHNMFKDCSENFEQATILLILFP